MIPGEYFAAVSIVLEICPFHEFSNRFLGEAYTSLSGVSILLEGIPSILIGPESSMTSIDVREFSRFSESPLTCLKYAVDFYFVSIFAWVTLCQLDLGATNLFSASLFQELSLNRSKMILDFQILEVLCVAKEICGGG